MNTAPKLWTPNFTRLILATTLGAAGGIAGSFALSFLVYDETGSTFAAALLIALRILPGFVIPLLFSPIMDRLPRKPFLVGGDLANGVLYLLAGAYLLRFPFSYTGYLCFSLLLASLESFDMLAYDSIFPKLIPKGMEEKGYAVSGMVYPVLQVVMAPAAALLFQLIGVANILLIQGGLSLLAALVEWGIRIQERVRSDTKLFSPRQYWQDLKDAWHYLKRERGLQGIYLYMGVTNGVATGFSPILVAFFRTAPGFTMAMYSLFSVAEFAGRTLGGLFHYRHRFKPEHKFPFAYAVYQIYEWMDVLLLWLPYPLMLVNRGICGFLGMNSATLRQAAVQRYLPEEYRARINAFETVIYSLGCSLFSLAVGALGEVLSCRACVSVSALFASLMCVVLIWHRRDAVRTIYEAE